MPLLAIMQFLKFYQNPPRTQSNRLDKMPFWYRQALDPLSQADATFELKAASDA
jgi:hypothetical protein